MNPIFLAPYARLLVLLHGLAAIVLVGAATHHLVVAAQAIRGRVRRAACRIHATTTLCSYLATMVLGALAYPEYRYVVRALYLDRYEPWASNLFDIKENVGSLGLPLVCGAFVLARLDDVLEDREGRLAYAVLVVLAATIVWFDVVAGLLVTMARGV